MYSFKLLLGTKGSRLSYGRGVAQFTWSAHLCACFCVPSQTHPNSLLAVQVSITYILIQIYSPTVKLCTNVMQQSF